ncbi:MAG TPA: YqzL family protein [Sporolactobacillaceae bacterium]|nr:YqzL family protein [Sporolactobacillaceae bacterium]
MLDFTWKVFCMTGNIDTYLLLKEMEQGNESDLGTEDDHYIEEQPMH